MFDLGGDYVLTLLYMKMGSTLDGQIVGLGCAGSPHDFARITVDQVSHLAARRFYSFLRLPAEQM